MDINTRGILALAAVTILTLLFTLAYDWRRNGASGKTTRRPRGRRSRVHHQVEGGTRANEVLLLLLPGRDQVPDAEGTGGGTTSRHSVRPDLLSLQKFVLGDEMRPACPICEKEMGHLAENRFFCLDKFCEGNCYIYAKEGEKLVRAPGYEQ